jgi:hypothetical protein
MTTDAGRHWSRQPTRNVSSLLSVGSSVLALTYDHGGCPGPCNVRVDRAHAGSGSWSTVMSAEPQASYTTLAGQSGGAVAVQAGNLASASAKGRLAVSSDSGGHWTQIHDPCGTRDGHEYDLVDATAVGAAATVSCARHIGQGREFTSTSTDRGRHFGPPALLTGQGFGHLLALGEGHFVASTTGIVGSGQATYRIVISDDRGASWRNVLSATEPIYDQPEQVAGTSALLRSANGVLTYIADAVHVWRSLDGGRTWHQLRLQFG